jgi:hypothetical protein
MRYERTEFMQHAYIHLADILEAPPQVLKNYDKACSKILVKDLKLSENDRTLLITLLKIGKANVYKLSKTQDLGHYSTVLRALRRLRKWNLVRLLPEGNSNRGEKVFTLTLFGEFVAVLAKGGWQEVAQKLAEISQKFCECIETHQTINKYHYLYVAEDTLLGLMFSPRFTHIQPDIEELVITAEHGWIMDTVIEKLHDYKSRPEAIKELKKLSHIDWIRSLIFSIIDEETAIESDWLNVLANFRKDLKSAEKNAQLTQFVNAQERAPTTRTTRFPVAASRGKGKHV